MPRIRSIKPEFWQDEEIASWPFETRLLYVGLWNLADDEGRLRAHPGLIKSQVLPFDVDLDIVATLAPIIESGKLVVFKSSGQTFGWLPNFNDNQVINRPKKSKLPPPPSWASTGSLTDHGSVSDGSSHGARTGHGSVKTGGSAGSTGCTQDRGPDPAEHRRENSVTTDTVAPPEDDHGSVTDPSLIDPWGKEGKGKEGRDARAREANSLSRPPAREEQQATPQPPPPNEPPRATSRGPAPPTLGELTDAAMTMSHMDPSPQFQLAQEVHADTYAPEAMRIGRLSRDALPQWSDQTGAVARPLVRLVVWLEQSHPEANAGDIARRMVKAAMDPKWRIWRDGDKFLSLSALLPETRLAELYAAAVSGSGREKGTRYTDERPATEPGIDALGQPYEAGDIVKIDTWHDEVRVKGRHYAGLKAYRKQRGGKPHGGGDFGTASP